MALLNRTQLDNPPGMPNYLTKNYWGGIGKNILKNFGVNTENPTQVQETPVPLPQNVPGVSTGINNTITGGNTLVRKSVGTTLGGTGFTPTEAQIEGTTTIPAATPKARTPMDEIKSTLNPIDSPTSVSAGNLEDLKREGIATSKYESAYMPEKSESVSALDQYKNMVDKAVRTGGLVDAANTFYNMGIAQRELNRVPGDKLEAPIVRAPRLISPAQAIKTATTDEIKRTYAGARQQLSELGRSDLLVGLTADEVAAKSDVAAQAAITDYDVINKNIAAETEALNLSDSIRMDVDFKNMQMQIQENMMSGQIISEAVASIGDTARQFVNRMTEAEYDKWVADLLTRERNMQFLG